MIGVTRIRRDNGGAGSLRRALDGLATNFPRSVLRWYTHGVELIFPGSVSVPLGTRTKFYVLRCVIIPTLKHH
jgi:hypothetical protein